MKRIFACLLLGLLAVPLSAQSEASTVSGLRASVDGQSIWLFWTDSPLPGASYLVFRSTRAITEDTFSGAVRLAVVPAGRGAYSDTPPDGKSYFYAVLVRERTGTIDTLFVPSRNATSLGVAVGTSGSAAPVDVAGLTATATADGVTLAFRSPQAGAVLVVYRSTRPIRSVSDLLNAVTVGLVGSGATTFDDAVVPGIPYFYAVIDAKTLRTGTVSLTPGANATEEPVELAPDSGGNAAVELAPERPRPLPYLVITSGLQSGHPLTPSGQAEGAPATPLSAAAAAAVASLLAGIPAKAAAGPTPGPLKEDTAVSPGLGDEATLEAILGGPFAARSWGDAAQALEDFLSVERPKAVAARARLYLAEADYELGKYRASFLEFLSVEDRFYAAAQPWMTAIYAKLREDNASAGP